MKVALVGEWPLQDNYLDGYKIARCNGLWLKDKKHSRCSHYFTNCCEETDFEMIEEIRSGAFSPDVVVTNWNRGTRAALIEREATPKYPPGICFVQVPFDPHPRANACGSQFEFINYLAKFYNMVPFTGAIALEYLRHVAHPEEILVTGMTMYSDDPVAKVTGYRGPHSIPAHIQYLRDVRRCDARVSFDAKLNHILDTYEAPNLPRL